MGRALYQCTRAAQRLVFIAPVQPLCTLQKGKPLTTFNSAALFLLIAQTCVFGQIQQRAAGTMQSCHHVLVGMCQTCPSVFVSVALVQTH